MIKPLGVQFLRSYRNVTSANKAQGNAMHRIGMRTSHITDFPAQQASGYENVGFIQNDLCNHFGTKHRAQVVDGDTEVETYIWLLGKFLDAMDHKMPLSVITDGDKAMRRAIKTITPTA
ncbi:hypothetical protein ACSBR1_039207 [Camellia fascicularis]